MIWHDEHIQKVRQDFECAARIYKLAHELKYPAKPLGSCYTLYVQIVKGTCWANEGEVLSGRDEAIQTFGWAIRSVTWRQHILFEMMPGPTQRRLRALYSSLLKGHELLNEYRRLQGKSQYYQDVTHSSDALFASASVVQAVREVLDVEVLKHNDPHNERFIRYAGEWIVLIYEARAFNEDVNDI